MKFEVKVQSLFAKYFFFNVEKQNTPFLSIMAPQSSQVEDLLPHAMAQPRAAKGSHGVGNGHCCSIEE